MGVFIVLRVVWHFTCLFMKIKCISIRFASVIAFSHKTLITELMKSRVQINYHRLQQFIIVQSSRWNIGGHLFIDNNFKNVRQKFYKMSLYQKDPYIFKTHLAWIKIVLIFERKTNVCLHILYAGIYNVYTFSHSLPSRFKHLYFTISLLNLFMHILKHFDCQKWVSFKVWA